MENKEKLGIKDKIHIVLTGPDGKVKDERGEENATDKEPKPAQ